MTNDQYQPVIFKEVQRFRQWWLWVLMIGIGVVAGGSMIIAASHTKSNGGDHASDPWVWVFALCIMIGVPMLMYIIKMTTTVTRDMITIRYFPIWTKRIPIRDIKSCTAREYHAIREYGGWGIKIGFARGWAYTVSGSYGVQLTLDAGNELLIGSQRHLELASIINGLLRK
jgi:MFS family permease